MRSSFCLVLGGGRKVGGGGSEKGVSHSKIFISLKFLQKKKSDINNLVFSFSFLSLFFFFIFFFFGCKGGLWCTSLI